MSLAPRAWSSVVAALLFFLAGSSRSVAQRTPNASASDLASAASVSAPPAALPLAASEADRGRDYALHYALDRLVTVFRRPDSSRAYVRLVFREPVHLVREGLGPHGFWCEVETDDGARGFVACSAISNVWLLVSKPDRRLYVHRGPERVATLVADVGYNAFADKEQRGSRRERDHWRTPEGTFYVVKKNPASQFHKAFLLNYPQPDDARRGLGRGLITQAEHDAIMEAARTHRPPPMDTPLGGWIEIHGDGTGAATNWTEGCIAIPNDDMDWLWRLVHRGTPVVVE